jgi:thioredoxin reductase (NADPH)
MSLAPIECDALVIGAGPVGLFQVFQLGLLESSCHVVDARAQAGGQCAQLYGDKPIYDIPGTPVTTGHGLVESLLRQIEPFTPTFHFGQQVATLARQDDGRLAVGTSRGQQFVARTVYIAAGVGAFLPRHITLPGLSEVEGTQLFYHPESLERFAGQSVVVQGGDEEALGAALELIDKAAQVTLVHRRDVFQGDEDLQAQVRARIAAGKLRLAIGQPTAFVGNQLTLETPEGQPLQLDIDAWLAYPGISPRLGPIADWGLQLARKQVPVDTERFQTCEPGVFAVGDINTYPGKKKLIVCGFHEATLAAWAGAAIVFPDKAIALQYTTTSTRLHELLGVSHPTR